MSSFVKLKEAEEKSIFGALRCLMSLLENLAVSKIHDLFEIKHGHFDKSNENSYVMDSCESCEKNFLVMRISMLLFMTQQGVTYLKSY